MILPKNNKIILYGWFVWRRIQLNNNKSITTTTVIILLDNITMCEILYEALQWCELVLLSLALPPSTHLSIHTYRCFPWMGACCSGHIYLIEPNMHSSRLWDAGVAALVLKLTSKLLNGASSSPWLPPCLTWFFIIPLCSSGTHFQPQT